MELVNTSWDHAFTAAVNWIHDETKDLNATNIRYLFHGTEKGAAGIMEHGFDSRYFKGGKYGRGAYFAENPALPARYAKPDQ